MEDVLGTVSERSGLPLALLDERERLDVDALRRFFGARVIGQPEAVECMVERVALVKAGLTDPTRPQAVLLFVGPTGTGKTEIAKALAEYLFGSPDRMIRIDMSEYQNPGGARRCWATTSAEDALAGRPDPPPAVLGRAARRVREGRPERLGPVPAGLRRRAAERPAGRAADFRHAVIIMTSNLGAKVRTGPRLGFTPTGGGFAAGSVEQAVTQAFRPEFLNRIDRTVVFRPLSRPVMREILAARARGACSPGAGCAPARGRSSSTTRRWSSCSQGFTPDLGARPLKRAVERHFLTPLALAIAGHDVPEGDQFLFVRAGGDGLKVTFEDPDAPEAAAATPPETTLRTLAREGGGRRRPARGGVRGRVGADRCDGWTPRPRCWSGWPSRASGRTRAASRCSSEIELRDRMEAGLRSAGSLLHRIRYARRPPAALVRRAAQRLILLDAALDALGAGEPADAELQVDGDPEFGPRIVAMYQAWAHERGMRLEDVRGARRAALPLERDRLGVRRAADAARRRAGSTCSRCPTAAAATTAGACA